jgi:hypothetical protein
MRGFATQNAASEAAHVFAEGVKTDFVIYGGAGRDRAGKMG